MNNNPDSHSNTATGGMVDSSPIPYVVCLMDILGQKEELSKWDIRTEDPEIQSKAVSGWQKTVCVVQRFKRRFMDTFDKMGSCTVPEKYAAATSHEQEIYDRYRNNAVCVQQFSDTFVFYTPLINSSGDISVVGIHKILGACCFAMLSSLCEKAPVRGGITIGLASELAPTNLYGPALKEAYNLENKVAKYPRIVVSRQVTQSISTGQTYSQDPEIQKRSLLLANDARSYICSDTDGHVIIDYLGPGVLKLLPNNASVVKGISYAYNFVRSQIDLFEQEKNDKLACRYHQLMRYIKERLALWDLKEGDGS
jgi:hypothetical protein